MNFQARVRDNVKREHLRNTFSSVDRFLPKIDQSKLKAMKAVPGPVHAPTYPDAWDDQPGPTDYMAPECVPEKITARGPRQFTVSRNLALGFVLLGIGVVILLNTKWN